MKKYIIGRCDKCGNINAAAVKHDEKTWKEDIVEFVEGGHVVSQLETDERVILEGCKDDCPNKPYHEVKEIRPEKAGELWKHEDDSIGIIIKQSESSPLGIVFNNGKQKHLSDTNLASGKDKPYREYMIHNKNGWTLIYSPDEEVMKRIKRLEDDSVERIEIDAVRWERHEAFYTYPKSTISMEPNGRFNEFINRGPMKMILEIPKI